MKLGNILVVAILVVIVAAVISAGCVSSEVKTEEKSNDNIIVGTWYSDTFYDSGAEDYCHIKVFFSPTNTGRSEWYDLSGKYYYGAPFDWEYNSKYDDYNLFYKGGKEGDKGIWTYSNGRMLTDDGIILTKIDTSSDEFDLTDSSQNIIQKSKHLESDYVESGDYYLEDAMGKSFTETLRAGDISEYVKGYNNVNAGKWIVKVREMSNAHHAFESMTGVTDSVVYQTIDTTMKNGAKSCCDLAILAARGLKELGYDVCILVFPQHMDIGVNKKDIALLKGQIDKGRYGVYAKSNVMYDDYYYIDIADYQNVHDVGVCGTEKEFVYDMTLQKIITL